MQIWLVKMLEENNPVFDQGSILYHSQTSWLLQVCNLQVAFLASPLPPPPPPPLSDGGEAGCDLRAWQQQTFSVLVVDSSGWVWAENLPSSTTTSQRTVWCLPSVETNIIKWELTPSGSLGTFFLAPVLHSAASRDWVRVTPGMDQWWTDWSCWLLVTHTSLVIIFRPRDCPTTSVHNSWYYLELDKLKKGKDFQTYAKLLL